MKSRFNLPEGENVQEKPLIFGENVYDTDRIDDLEYADRHWDASYVPGYSEMRAENEFAIKEGRTPIPMPRLQWVRVKKPDGATYVMETDEGMVEWVRLGYRACGVADLKKYGYGWPPAAGSGPSPDGLICRGGDLALFIVDEERAARNVAKRRQELGEEASYVPESSTGEVHAVEDERLDIKGRDLHKAIEEGLPIL